MISVKFIVSKLGDLKSEGGWVPPYHHSWAEISEQDLNGHYGLCRAIDNHPHNCLASTLGGDLTYETLSWMADELNKAYKEGAMQAAIMMRPKASA